MPTWGEILQELKQLSQQKVQFPGGASVFDFVRRKYLRAVALRTGRNVILYATKWTQPGGDPSITSITAEDVHGFMEVIHGLNGDALDLILHSPGGSAEATEALVLYLRSKFKDIRVIVPHAAMSAATMLACAANRIVMGKHSFLGPIDPQMIFHTEAGVSSLPAHAILEQFKLAQKECQDPGLLPIWIPILRLYGPALIVQCKLAQELSRSLVTQWLTNFMFQGAPDAAAKASKVAKELYDHSSNMSHGRFLSRQQLRGFGLDKIDDLEADQGLQDDVLSVYHATSHTFTATHAMKIIENHMGKAFLKVQQVVQFPMPMAMPFPPIGQPPPPGLQPPPAQ